MQQINVMLEPAKAFLNQVVTFLPQFLLAVAVLVLGWLLAKFLQFIVVRGLKAVNFNVVTEKAGIDGFFKQGGVKKTTIDILGILVYWLTILIALLMALETVHLEEVSKLFSQVALYVPKVIIAVLIVAFGLYLARFVGDGIVAYAKNVGIEDSDLIGRVCRYAIVVFVVLIALDQLSVAGNIVFWTFFILVGGVVLALAIAFGLGGQKWAATQLEKLAKEKKK